MYTITNIYVLAAFGTIGGALFGFDVSSMSAWIGRDQYLNYFNHPDANMQGGVSDNLQTAMKNMNADFANRSPLRCLVDPSSVLFALDSSPTNGDVATLSWEHRLSGSLVQQSSAVRRTSAT